MYGLTGVDSVSPPSFDFALDLRLYSIRLTQVCYLLLLSPFRALPAKSKRESVNYYCKCLGNGSKSMCLISSQICYLGMIVRMLERMFFGSWVMGRIIRSLAESMNKWTGSSKLKKLRKFVVTYCPEVMDNLEIMAGITENWRVEL